MSIGVDIERVTPDIKPSPGRGVCRLRALCPAIEGHPLNFHYGGPNLALVETPAFGMAVSVAG
jgi:hypothetical protein